MMGQIWVLMIQVTLALNTESREVFKIRMEELNGLVESGELGTLEDVLRTEGTIAVVGLSEEYEAAVKGLKMKAPECLKEEKLPEFELPDGSLRTTFAKSSEENVEFPDCIREEGKVISETFDDVYDVVVKLLTKVAGMKNLEWKILDKGTPKNLSSLHQKEHVHVYRPSTQISDQEYVVPFHYDSGLLLMLTSFNKQPLKIKNNKGKEVSTAEVGDNGILVLVAKGLTDWLLKGTSSSSKFFPVPHAVPKLAKDISSRTVFARMKLVPMTALPCRMVDGSDKATYRFFGEFFNDIIRISNMELCPILRPEFSSLEQQWKELKWLECSQNMTAYCWMNCLDIPPPCITANQNPTCVNGKNEPCCTDPDNTENCVNMDGSCAFSCPAVYESPPPPPHLEEPFCNGYGTDMYMTGFQASGQARNPCVILLFESWILNTRVKFFFACIGVILLGILIEYMICARRNLQNNKILIRLRNPGRKHLIIFLFGLNIGSGYAAMLVAMTYSVELFLCLVMGLVIGHAIFNSSAAVGESADPCCASQVVDPPKEGQCL